MKIYTRSGDFGETGLYGGERVRKDDPLIQALGDIDELNASLGVARTLLSGGPFDHETLRIQDRLFDLGAELATCKRPASCVSEEDVTWLEQSIDRMTIDLPPLRAFILPGGSPAAAALHLSRTVCRRAERSVLTMDRHRDVRGVLRVYLNRLSDWLFVAARTANHESHVSEVEWHSKEDQRSC